MKVFGVIRTGFFPHLTFEFTGLRGLVLVGIAIEIALGRAIFLPLVLSTPRQEYRGEQTASYCDDALWFTHFSISPVNSAIDMPNVM